VPPTDTVDASIELGLPVDGRDCSVGVDILRDLGIRSSRLMTHGPAECSALSRYGLKIAERVPLMPRVTAHNINYLVTKRDRLVTVSTRIFRSHSDTAMSDHAASLSLNRPCDQIVTISRATC
jgi:GTP cyclohydrolase II